MKNNICRVAMWSGPRNISTAMMRSFENRDDCAVVDEPLYGFYLKATGYEHPGKDEIIAAMDCDWQSVTDELINRTPEPCTVFYQKHMTHHMLDNVDLSFIRSLKNCFLVRDPAQMIISYAKVRPDFTLDELGLPQQLNIFKYCQQNTNEKPLVLDSANILAKPNDTLAKLCRYLDIPFSNKMLSWPQGKRSSDGIWAKHWYANVESTTGFSNAITKVQEVPEKYLDMYHEAKEIYQEMLS